MNPIPKTHYLWAVLLFASGFAIHAVFFGSTSKSSTVVPLPESSSLDSKDALRDLTERLAAAQTENAKLRAQLEERVANASVATAVAQQPQETPPGAVRAFSFSDQRFEDMMSQQVNRELDVYAARLNLSDSQRSQLEEVMLLRMLQFRERMGPHGPRTAEPGEDVTLITQADIDNLAAEILSPSQLEEYEEMRAQEVASRSEMMATSQLSQIAPQLGLSEEQKDQVYAIYYNQSLQMTDGVMNPDLMRESREQADEQIREILDEKQRAVFETIRANQNFGNFTIIAR